MVDNPTATYYVHTGLTNSTTLYNVVSIWGTGGESANSAQISDVLSEAIVPEEYFFAGHAIENGTNLSLTV